MSLEIIGTYAITVCLIIGAAFAMIGTIGLLKFNDPMVRLHAPTKVGTIGIGALLLASMIHSYVFSDGSMHELLIMAFLFVTSPISANFISKVNIHRRNCDVPPVPPQDEAWSTLDVPEDEVEVAPAK
jgi:multicomponent K+:H+ antiporter subunit G